MRGALPQDPEAARAFLKDGAAVSKALAHLSGVLGLGTLERFGRGSALVAGTASQVLKVFLPEDQTLAATEAAALQALAGRLPIPTPELLDAGELEGWPYVIMTRLTGVEAREQWSSFERDTQTRLARGLGSALAALHALPAPAEVPASNWAHYAQDTACRVVEAQLATGCPQALAQSLPAFLARVDLASVKEHAWLHTEVMLEHLLVAPDGSGWTGLFDFEPSWVGPPEYEMASVGLFVSRGDAHLLRAVREGLGWIDDPERPQRLMAYACLHRYSRLSWYLERLNAPLGATPEELAEAWFSEDGGLG